MQEAQARGVDIDAVRAGKNASEAMRPQSQPQQGAAEFKAGPTPPPAAAGGRKPPSPPSSPRNRSAANNSMGNEQMPPPVSNRPLSPRFWQQRFQPGSAEQTFYLKAEPIGGASPIDTIFAISFPKGTIVHVGDAATQGEVYMGGTRQVVIAKPWEIAGVKVVETYSLPREVSWSAMI